MKNTTYGPEFNKKIADSLRAQAAVLLAMAGALEGHAADADVPHASEFVSGEDFASHGFRSARSLHDWAARHGVAKLRAGNRAVYRRDEFLTALQATAKVKAKPVEATPAADPYDAVVLQFARGAR